MRVVCFYHKETGRFDGGHPMTPDPKLIAPNTPADHSAIEGDHFDALSQRVDVKTGEVKSRGRPAPTSQANAGRLIAMRSVGSGRRRWLRRRELMFQSVLHFTDV
jgi:hypothetical protein